MSTEAGQGPVLPLACPTCARRFPLSERFCPDCETPLVYVGLRDEQPITGAHERAGKVDPRYTGGNPVKVAYARNLAEAQLIQGILLDQGIPSFERRTRGFDVPDFLAAGPRDILVPGAAAEVARGGGCTHDVLLGVGAGLLQAMAIRRTRNRTMCQYRGAADP